MMPGPVDEEPLVAAVRGIEVLRQILDHVCPVPLTVRGTFADPVAARQRLPSKLSWAILRFAL